MNRAHIPAEVSNTITGWRKGSRSGAAGHCFEVARHGAHIAVRQSKAPDAGAFLYDPEEWDAFLSGATAGEFDDL